MHIRRIFDDSLIFLFHPFLEKIVIYPKMVVRIFPDGQDLKHDDAKGPDITPENKITKLVIHN